MPGNLIPALLSLVASHLVLLTLAVFLAVGGYLAGWWSLGPGAPGAPAAKQVETPVLSTAPESPAVPAGRGDRQVAAAPPRTRPAQPAMIGGTLPNYNQPDGGRFRPGEVPKAAWGRPDRDALVQDARRAYWNGNFDAAERVYMDAITAYPDDPDLFGELGNLYQAMGLDDRALDAYFEAARRLQASGELEKMSQVMDLLESRGYPDVSPSGR
jgi:hypothetical protein